MQDELEKTRSNEVDMKENYIPLVLENYKKQLVKEVVAEVNQINGGPVSEYKVKKMIKMARDAEIKDDIDLMETKLRNFMDEEIFTKIETNRNNLEKTDEFLERVDNLVMEHQGIFEFDKTEPLPLTPEEELALGIETRFGVKFQNNEFMPLTKL